VFSKVALDIPPTEFWQLTWAEFWPLYNAKMGNTVKAMSKDDLKGLEEEWGRGKS